MRKKERPASSYSRAAERVARRTKEREEARQFRIAHENETQRQMRLAAEEQVKTQRAKEIQSMVNRCRKEKEGIETFFLQSSNRFNSKYGTATKKIAGDIGIDRIVSSRRFTDLIYAHRCVPCGYHQPESLSISKIYQHLYENKDSHMQFTLGEIDKNYNALIADTCAEDDNPDLRQQKLSKDLEALKKLKGEKYRLQSSKLSLIERKFFQSIRVIKTPICNIPYLKNSLLIRKEDLNVS